MSTILSLTCVDDSAQMIDISAVKANSTDEKIRELVEIGQKKNCYLVTILPSQTALARSLLGESSAVRLGGNVGFP